MKLIKWLDKEWDIVLDTAYPSKYIEDLIAPLYYRRTWSCRRDKFLILEHMPINPKDYFLTYNIKREKNEDIEELKFIIYLVDKAVDYINNLETIYNTDEEKDEEQDI